MVLCGVRVILPTTAGDTNPKRAPGRQTMASFTLRVSMGRLISDRVQYNHSLDWGIHKDRPALSLIGGVSRSSTRKEGRSCVGVGLLITMNAVVPCISSDQGTRGPGFPK